MSASGTTLANDTEILRLKEEVEILTRDRDRLRRESDNYRQIANRAEDETEKRRIAYLELEAKYEEERKSRFALEMTLARTHTPEPAVANAERRLVDAGVGTTGDAPTKEYQPTRGQSMDINACEGTERSRNVLPKDRTPHENQGKHKSVEACLPHTLSAASPTPAPSTVSNSCFNTTPPPASAVASVLPPKPKPICAPPPPVNSNEQIGEKSGRSSFSVAAGMRPNPFARYRQNPGDISRYLTDTTNLPVNPPPQPLSISRRALTRTYGLPGMGFLWASKDKNYKFLLPTYEENPNMPRVPGAPGLLLSCRSEMTQNGPWTLFVKVEGGNKPRLNYAGEYTCRVVGKLTAQEFANQSQAVKESWGAKISEHKRHQVYRDMRARITLRKRLGYAPSSFQVSYESDLIKAKGYTSDLTRQDVISALERGDEKLDVIKLICVSYNHGRARAYAKAQNEYEDYIIANPPRKRKRDSYEPEEYLGHCCC